MRAGQKVPWNSNSLFEFNISAPAATAAPPVPSSSCVCPSQTLPPLVTVTVNETVHYTPPSVYVTQNVTVIQNVTQDVTLSVTQYVSQFVTQNVTQVVPSFSNIYVTVDRTVISTVTHINTVTSVNNITIKEIERVAEEIKKNLTVDTKTTSSYLRSKTSAHDPRESAKYMGLLGTLLVVVPMGVILLLDVKKIFTDIRTYENIFKKD